MAGTVSLCRVFFSLSRVMEATRLISYSDPHFFLLFRLIAYILNYLGRQEMFIFKSLFVYNV